MKIGITTCLTCPIEHQTLRTCHIYLLHKLLLQLATHPGNCISVFHVCHVSKLHKEYSNRIHYLKKLKQACLIMLTNLIINVN